MDLTDDGAWHYLSADALLRLVNDKTGTHRQAGLVKLATQYANPLVR